MTFKKPLSRREVLRGAGGIILGLPFLEAMLPRFASAATTIPRLVAIYGGVPSYMSSLPPVGPLTTLNNSMSAFQNVKQHIGLLSNMSLPVYAKGTTPPPGGCVQQQHYCVPAPFLGGVPSYDSKPMLNNAHTIDQLFSDLAGPGSKYKSIQARVQAAGYLYGASGGIISSRYVNGVLSTFAPTPTPLDLYNKLFSGGLPSSGTTTTPVISAKELNRRSVLDLVINDSNRLISSLGGSDKTRMELHFDQIRDIEKRIASTTPPTQPPSSSCALPANPGPSPAVSTPGSLGGWGSETTRGDLMADIIALALACDLTRAVSWQLTWDQCGLGSFNISGRNGDLHQISHDVNNDGTLRTAMEAHLNWHCARMARLVSKLASLPEGSGSVLDNTFICMGFGEGISAHNRSTMHLFAAGCPSTLKMGQHIAGKGEHSARIWIAGLNGLGFNTNTLGQISGPMTALLK